MGHFVPHTDAELEQMLSDIGLDSLEQLFEVIPEALRLAGGLEMPDGVSQHDVLAEMSRLADKNPVGTELVCFAGAGAYDHDIPPVTPALMFRSEFVTAYTPYQAEVSQGVLQALFEYQTLIARLSGLEVANASLYDGASALVEAGNLACASTRRSTLWVSGGINPRWRQVLATYAAGTGHQLVDLPLSDAGTTPAVVPEGSDPPAGVIIGYPNYLGVIEDLTAARALADSQGAQLLVAFDPVASALLRSPGELGADVVVGEGQPFGTPLSFGGPYLGLFACRLEHVRRLPGRLVGLTEDNRGTTSYVTTLRAREQDIRREKASSNVCTNQTLIAVAAMIQLSWLGTRGLRELALRCARGTRLCRDLALKIPGVTPMVDGPVVREFALNLPVPAERVIDRLLDDGYLGGVSVGLAEGVATTGDPETNGLLVSVTERRTRAEIEGFVASLEKVVR